MLLARVAEKNRQSAHSRVPFLAQLIGHRQAAFGHWRVDSTLRVRLAANRIGSGLLAPVPPAKMFFDRTLVHKRVLPGADHAGNRKNCNRPGNRW